MGGDTIKCKITTFCRAVLLIVLGLGFVLAGTAVAQPNNDNFRSRTAIIGGNVTVSGTLAGATSEAGEPIIPGVSSGQTAWWTWIAPSNGIVVLSVSATNFDPLLAVYKGSGLADLSLVASNTYLACYDDTNTCGCHWRLRTGSAFHVQHGTAYQIQVDSAVIVDASWQGELVPDGSEPPPNAVPVDFDVEQLVGFNYYVPVQITNIPAGASVQLTFQFTPAPTNDDFESRAPLVGTRAHVNSSNSGATKQAGEPDHGGNPGGSSVWYSWAAPASGRATISINEIPVYAPPSWSGSWGFSGDKTGTWIWGGGTIVPSCGIEIDQNPTPIFFPVFAAYTGNSFATLVPTDYQLMNMSAYPYAIEFDAVKGQTYDIAFDGNMGTTDDITLYLALTRPASNNNFANRIKLHGIYVVATGFNAGATHEVGEPVALPGSTGKSVWWSWVAPVSGSVTIDLSGSDYTFPLAVYTGTSLRSLKPAATGDGSLTFNAVAGQVYQIAVSDSGGLTGAIDLTLTAPVVEAPLAKTQRGSGNSALLKYSAARGTELLLERCSDGVTWQSVATATSHNGSVSFLARPAPGANGPYYRAIIVDFNP